MTASLPTAHARLSWSNTVGGTSTLTLGVLPLAPERQRLVDVGLTPGPIEETKGYFIMRILDPDGNLAVFASARK